MPSPDRRIVARTFLVAAAALAFPSAARPGPSVTVYSHDLGFVRETRTLELRTPRDTVRIPDVSERLDFSSVRLAPAAGGRVWRLAYRFDVASGDGVLDRAKGGRVSVALRGDRVVEGTLVAVDGSWLTVREDDGSVHTLARGSADDVRLTGLTQALSLRPALEAVVESDRRGRIEAELSYLTGGLSWSAEHTLVRSGETRATWSAAVTVENTTGREFADARLKLVAGEPSRAAGPPVPMPGRAMMMEMSVAAKAPDLSEQSFSEYHLYTLDRPATLRDRETQTLTMIEPHAVTISPRYRYRGGDPRGVQAQLEVVNSAAAGLGVPLPAGRVRIYEPDPAGDLQFIGETNIKHTAEGEKLTLEVGTAFDLAAERRELFNKRITDREREYAVEVKLRNRKKTEVTIVVEEGVGGDFEITQKSHPFTRKDANTLEFAIAVPAGKEAILSYTARVRY
jgi:hypothetical protein